MLLLLIGALVIRTCGAAIRTSRLGPVADVTSGLVCAIAVWLAAGAVGAWSPVWSAVALGLIGGLIIVALPWRLRFALWWALDGVVFVAVAQLSVPAVGPIVTGAGTILVVVTAILLDVLAAWMPAAARTGAALAVPAGGALVLFAFPVLPWSLRDGLTPLSTLELATSLANLGVIPARNLNAQRKGLPTGAVAWLDRPSGSGPFPGALFFHGAHRAGAFQPAAVAARHALRDAGFVVLAVDHPGYGESPAPSVNANIAEWDPLPTAMAALELLRKDPAVNRVIVVGHSMGTNDVLRLLAAKASLDGAVLFGSGALDTNRPEYWYGRFLTDRRLVANAIAAEKVQELISRYYDAGRFARELTPSHPPIVFGRFEHEWPLLVQLRDQLFAQFPGRKVSWEVAGSHYFNSFSYAGLVAGDIRIIRAVASRFGLVATDLKNGTAIASTPTGQ